MKSLRCTMHFDKYVVENEYYIQGQEVKEVEYLATNTWLRYDLQRELDNFNNEFNDEGRVAYHGMWDLDEAVWRLNNNWKLFVMYFKDRLIGWQWNILNEINIYRNRTGGIVYNPMKKDEFTFVDKLLIKKDEVYGCNFYLNKDYRGKTHSIYFKAEHPRMVRAQGYNRMIWDIESWNRQSLSTLEHTKGITTEEISYES